MTRAKAYADAHVDTDVVDMVESAEMVNDVARLSTTFASRVHRPTTVTELVKIVKNASENSQSVTVRGHSHTMGGQSVPMDGEVSVDMTRLDGITVDREKMLMTVQTGATWCQVIEALNPMGLTPVTMQSYCSFTVGGTIGVNAHGITSDSSLAESIVSLEYVSPHGTLKTAKSTHKAFGYLVGGYGLFGIITQATMRIKTNVSLTMSSKVTTPGAYHKRMMKLVKDTEHVRVKMARLNVFDPKHIQLFEFSKESDEVNTAKLPPLRQPSKVGKILWKWFMPTESFRKLRYMYEEYMQQPIDIGGQSLSQNALMYESAEALNRLYNPLVNVDRTHVLQEFFVPAPKIKSYINFISSTRMQEMFHKNPSNVQLLNITIRFVKKDQITALPYATKDVYAFVYYFRITRHEDATAHLKAIHMVQNAKVIPMGGSFYLPYLHHYTDRDVAACYPGMANFVKRKVKDDPRRTFWNTWFGRYSTAALYSLMAK